MAGYPYSHNVNVQGRSYLEAFASELQENHEVTIVLLLEVDSVSCVRMYIVLETSRSQNG